MNKDSIPEDLDVFISLLGEIDMLKGQVSVLDKNTHIALSQSDTSAILGNAECFRILKMIERHEMYKQYDNFDEYIPYWKTEDLINYDDYEDDESEEYISEEYYSDSE